MEKKKDKLLNSCVVSAIVLLIGTLAGISYAYWSYTTIQTTSNQVQTDCFEIELEDVTSAINLEKMYPISDEAGMELTPYTFKVTNVCNAATLYNIQLEIMDTTNRLSSDFVAVSFDEREKKILNSYESADPTYAEDDYTAVESRKIGSGILSAKESQTFSIRLWMDESVTSEDDSMNKDFISKVSVTASLADVICKRATEMHTEICNNASSATSYCQADGYAIGDTIEYGSEGDNNVLTAGDAFDCDVNGDNTYDSETERFYYVSDYYDTDTKIFDSNYATLIYYNSVSSGLPDNTSVARYSSTIGGYLGPQGFMGHLPTSTQWSNVSLKTETRNILDQDATTRVTGFSYSGRVARNLTYQEVVKACYDGTTLTTGGSLSSKCKFLYENTKYANDSLRYGYWLETLGYCSTTATNAYTIENRAVGSGGANNTSHRGARPVIDVNKDNIEY